ncbi:MAG: hypothetical protein K0Q81_413, partial [Paenibacillus sp.]|nr:hypothetical protein [Paenibacillus sp.]
ADANTAHFHIEAGTHKFKAVGACFKGGQYKAGTGGFVDRSYFFLSSCIEEDVNRDSLPLEDNNTIKHSFNNIVL